MRIAFGTFWIRFRVRDCEGSRKREGTLATRGRKNGENGSEAIECGGRIRKETNVLTLYRCEMPRVKEGCRACENEGAVVEKREPRG